MFDIFSCLCISEKQKEEDKKNAFQIETDKTINNNNNKQSKDDFGILSLKIGCALNNSEINGSNINTTISYQLISHKEKLKNSICSNKCYRIQELTQSFKKESLKGNEYSEKYNHLVQEKQKKFKILNENKIYKNFYNKIDDIINDFKKINTVSESDDIDI